MYDRRGQAYNGIRSCDVAMGPAIVGEYLDPDGAAGALPDGAVNPETDDFFIRSEEVLVAIQVCDDVLACL